MEIDNLNALNLFAEKLTSATEFNALKPYPKRQGLYIAELFFNNYNDLTLTIMDIIKVSISALYALEENEGDRKFASSFAIAEVLGLALKLMPMEESLMLDQCYKLHLQLKLKEEENIDKSVTEPQ